MLEAAQSGPRFTISLKRSAQNLQLSTSWPADYPIFAPEADVELEYCYLSRWAIIDILHCRKTESFLPITDARIAPSINKCPALTGG
jgi:hypothetical protein